TAETLYRQILQKDAHHAGAWHFLGVIALARGDLNEACQAIEHSLRFCPHKAVYWNNYGAALKALGRWPEAQAAFSRAVAEKRVDFSYDAAGQLVTLTRYADLAGTQLVAQSDYTYDQAGRLRGLSHFQGETTFVEYTWNFDAANRLTQYINSVDGTADYTHDNTGQLTGADRRNGRLR
ncbi:hypothetical protein, partial [Thermogutta sp.]|uniref:hypothetical protein n=1 Tax=Thermogutta sp. TaxID=1962930 RepID=UPI003220393C